MLCFSTKSRQSLEPRKRKTGDAVAHGDLIGRLVLALGADHTFRRQSLLAEAMLQPAVREGEIRALAVQVSGHLRQERARKRRARARHVGQHQHQVGRVLLDHPHHPVGPVEPLDSRPDIPRRGMSSRPGAGSRSIPTAAWWARPTTRQDPQGGDALGRDAMKRSRLTASTAAVAVGNQLQGDPRARAGRSAAGPFASRGSSRL